MLQKEGALYILTCKCASRHSGVPFFDIWTSKSGPYPSVFSHFDLQMCFAPQRRAIFEHLNFKNGSDNEVFCTFWLANVLRATAACHFLDRNFKNGSETVSLLAFWLTNVLRATAACHFSPVCWTATSAPAALARLLFEHQEPQIIEKTQRFSASLTFRARAPAFYWLYACWSPFCWLDISTLLDTSTLLFNSAYCRKLDF